MTEIPEHLLKRSKERRAAMGLPGGESDGTDAAPAAAPTAVAKAAPAAAKAARAEPTPPPPPKPVPAHVAAAHARRRIPYWAMPVIALLPLWGLLYWNSVRVPPSKDTGLIEGQKVYTLQCSSCHGATGGGGAGPQLNQGEVLKTFKDPEDMIMWIYLGKEGGVRPDGSYGDATRPGGAHTVTPWAANMPAHTTMSAQDLADVTRYVRETLSGEPLPDAKTLAGYLVLAQAGIKQAQAGVLPSASTVKKGAPATGSASGATTPTTVAGG